MLRPSRNYRPIFNWQPKVNNSRIDPLFLYENVVYKLLPKRASFFLSSSVSSVIVTTPSDIFLAVLNDLLCDQMFLKQNVRENSSLFPSTSPLLRCQDDHTNQFTPVLTQTMTDRSTQSQYFCKPMKKRDSFRAILQNGGEGGKIRRLRAK